jgi:Bacteriophage head to tail connecting protein
MSLDQQQSQDNANRTLLESIMGAQQDKAIAAWINGEYIKAKNDRVQTERQWYMNLAFYFGKHYVQFVTQNASGNFQLRTPAAPPWRVRMTVNKVRGIIRHEISRLTSNKPTFTVLPATTEDEDQAAARIGEQIFEAAYADKHVAKVVRQAVWWASNCGTGFIKQYWDPDVLLKEPGPDGKPLRGDIIIERVSPFNIFVPNLEEEDLQKQPFIMHVTTKSPDFIKAAYGLEKLPTVKAEIPIEDSFLNMIGAKNSMREQVVVIECWIKPGGHRDFPNGGLVTLVGGQPIQVIKDAFPYAHGDFPFYKIDIVPTGKFYGESNTTDLLPLQKEYNRTKSQIIEAKNLMAKPRLIAPRGSVNAKQISSEPGQVIYYTPGLQPPTPLPMDSLPNYVLQELDRLQQDMDDISGQHEITRGNTPAQVTAATAITYLQEQDDTKLAYAVASIEESLQALGQHYLQFVTQFWDAARLVRIVGRDGAFEAQHWAGNALRGNTDIRVQSGSALPQSKAAKQAFVMDLLKLGVIPPQQALEILDVGGIEKVYEDYLVDKRQAERENLKMASIDPMLAVELVMPPKGPDGEYQIDPQTGQPVQPPPVMPANTWDNHQAHIIAHNRFRKTQQFELLPDPVKAIFEQHVMLHQMSLQAVTATMPNGQAGPDLQPGGGMAGDPMQQQQPPGAMPNG